MGCNILRNLKNKLKSFTHLLLVIFLIFSIIQLIPSEIKLIREASASSIWTDTNWLATENYSSCNNIDIISNSGDLKLHYEDEGLLITDLYNHRLVKMMIDGSGWATFGSCGSGKGQFNMPSGLAYDKKSGYIYVADYANHRIVKTKWGGSGWTTYGSLGVYRPGKGYFYHPWGICFDNSTDFIYVSDLANHRIVKTKMNGSGWTTLGSFTPGSGTKQFAGPTGIYYDTILDNLYISDSMNNRIVRTKMNGIGWATLGSFYTPGDIHYDGDTGNIYVADNNNNRIVKTMINGSGFSAYGSYGSGTGQFFYLKGICYDNITGYIYVADTLNYRIVKTKMGGSGWITNGSKGFGKWQFQQPFDIEFFGGHHYSNGYLTSRKFNLSAPANLLTLSWVGETPIETDIKFQLRSAPNPTALSLKDFVGPNGNSSKFYTKSGSKLWSGHNGGQWIQYKVCLSSDNFSKTPILKDVTLTYNLLPNSPTLISPSDGAQTNDNTTTFAWSFNDTDSSGQRGFQWQIDDDKNFSDIDYDSNEVISSKSSFTPTSPITDGIWYWRIRVKDSDDGWGPYSIPWMLLIDTTEPTSNVTFPKNNKFYNNIGIITGKATDPKVGSGINKVEVAIKSLGDNKYWAGTKWTSEITWLLTSGTGEWDYNTSSIPWASGSQYRVFSRAWDNVTNLERPDQGIVFNFDADYPTSIVEIPIDNSYYNNLHSISGSSIDIGGAGVKKVEITIKQTNDNKYWDGKTWISTETWLTTFGTNEWNYDSSIVDWTTGNQYIILSKAADNISNVEIPTTGVKFIFDTDKPLSYIEFPSNDMYLNNLDIIYGNATDLDGSGVDKVEISIRQLSDNSYWADNTWASDTYWLRAKGTNEWTYDASDIYWTTDIYYTIYSGATDKVGNKLNSRTGNTFLFDNKPPEQSISINNNSLYTNSISVSLFLESEDSGSGVILMAFSENDGEWTKWEDINNTKIYDLPQGDGEKIVYFKVQDRAGNFGKPVLDSIILDTKPPENEIVINNNNRYSNFNIVTLKLTAFDSLSGVQSMAFSFDAIDWSAWKPFKTKETITLPTIDGEKTVYFKVQDAAGNIAIASDTIILDTTPPHSLSILINNVVVETDSKLIVFKLNAIDDLSGVEQMVFCTDISLWNFWENYSETKSYELPPGFGEKIIYFRTKDRAGNVASPIFTTIILNEPETPQKSETSIFTNLVILLIIIIIMIIILSVIIVLKRKKKAKVKQSELTGEVVMVKPIGLPPLTTTAPQVAPAPIHSQLPKTTSVTEPPQITQTPPLPQLPPAQNLVKK